MKIFHIADLHLGKNLHQHSLLEDQLFYVKTLLTKIDDEKPDVLLIAGDVYDRTVPSGEATRLLDYLLTELSKRNLTVFMIAGNHDSVDRLQFAAALFRHFNIHIVTEYQGTLEMISLFDGQYHFYLLPFFRPAQIRALFPESEIKNYADALKQILKEVDLQKPGKHILLAHQFFVNNGGEALTSDSEEISVGGLEQIPAELVADFDYVALGHLHQPHFVQDEHIRYAGSPLAYSASELMREKSITCVEFQDKIHISELTYPKKHQVKRLKGYFKDLIEEAAEHPNDDYYYIELLDEHSIDQVAARFHRFYPNLLEIQMNHLQFESMTGDFSFTEQPGKLSTTQLFALFYQAETEQELKAEERKLLEDIEHQQTNL